MDIRCTNCGNTDFVPANIGEVSSIDGCMFISTNSVVTKTGYEFKHTADRDNVILKWNGSEWDTATRNDAYWVAT